MDYVNPDLLLPLAPRRRRRGGDTEAEEAETAAAVAAVAAAASAAVAANGGAVDPAAAAALSSMQAAAARGGLAPPEPLFAYLPDAPDVLPPRWTGQRQRSRATGRAVAAEALAERASRLLAPLSLGAGAPGAAGGSAAADRSPQLPKKEA